MPPAFADSIAAAMAGGYTREARIGNFLIWRRSARTTPVPRDSPYRPDKDVRPPPAALLAGPVVGHYDMATDHYRGADPVAFHDVIR